MTAGGHDDAPGRGRGHRPVVGIVGAGQLARMTAQAAISLDVTVRLLAERADDGAAQVTPGTLVGAPTDPAALAALAARCDVLTFDHELVDAAAVAALEAGGVVARPSAGALAVAQDKLAQRALFAQIGLPGPPHVVASPADLPAAAARVAETHGWPVVVKTARGGYDGRGVWVVDESGAASRLAADLVAGGAATADGALLVEPRVDLVGELAAVVVRRPGGESVAYPLVETVQRDGICVELSVPARVPARLATEAVDAARAVADRIGAVGVVALELFRTADGLLANEIAVRPHNSGHFSLGGAVTSQFENHLRAVLDLPLGETSLLAPSVVTVNVIAAGPLDDPAERRARLAAALAVPGASVHLYGKAFRAARKVGHVTCLGEDRRDALERARRAAGLLAGTVTATEAPDRAGSPAASEAATA